MGFLNRPVCLSDSFAARAEIPLCRRGLESLLFPMVFQCVGVWVYRCKGVFGNPVFGNPVFQVNRNYVGTGTCACGKKTLEYSDVCVCVLNAV